jgi:dihydropteroate synthase
LSFVISFLMTSITLRNRTLSWATRPLVMGILNVTPDSFSDGGVHESLHAAIDAASRMVEDGVDVIDVGGESTRPGSDPVSVDEELSRVIPVIEAIRGRWDVPVSVDTMKSGVARAALAAGADMVNDVTAMRFDEAMADVVREAGAPVILMHMRGAPKTMQSEIRFDDLMGEIASELREARDRAMGRGIERSKIFVDPGLGFGKTFDHNLRVLARCAALSDVAPIVIGASRKAFIGHLTGREAGRGRMAGSLAAVAAAFGAGAAFVRVHDVRETVDYLNVAEAIRNAG